MMTKNINLQNRILLIYLALVAITLAVFLQVSQHDFICLDDPVYVTSNNDIQSGITPKGVLWAFYTDHAKLWHPLTWISLMLDHQLYGLNTGGYHVTNLILHILSTLLLFELLKRMTGAVWRSAFVAALFAIHPLHVETVSWVTKRKDVLSGFFWMLTLFLYVYYTEKPAIQRYLLVLLCYACAVMSKPMVVTLPVIMILLDYWPLSRLRIGIKNKKGSLILWQLKEKTPFFILSMVSVFSVFYIHRVRGNPLEVGPPFASRLANAFFSFMAYLHKTFWPRDLSFFYPFSDQIPLWQVLGSAGMIVVISFAILMAMKRLPFLFVGWAWYAITIAPVIGIIFNSDRTMSDNYTYLPSIGIFILTAWSVPLLFPRQGWRQKILATAGMLLIAVLALMAWKQCGYWKDNATISRHSLEIEKNNYMAHNVLGSALLTEGKPEEAISQYNESIRLKPGYAHTYVGRGRVYEKLGQYQRALNDFNHAISLAPYSSDAFNSRGLVYVKLGRHQQALHDFNQAISLNPSESDAYLNRAMVYEKLGQYQKSIHDYNRINPGDADAFNNRGTVFYKLGRYQQAINDYSHAIRLQPEHADGYNNRGLAYGRTGRYQQAIDDFNKAIRLKPNFADAYNNRGYAHFLQGNKNMGCFDAQKACSLGMCKLFKFAKEQGHCNKM